MGARSLGEIERQWGQNFDKAVNTSRSHLRLIVSDEKFAELAKEIDREKNASRRDIYNNANKVPEKDIARIVVRATDVEDAYIDSLHAQRKQPKQLQIPASLRAGDTVVIWIKDHFYEDCRAEVIDYRRATDEFLVEIKSKRPNKQGFVTHPGAVGLMYVKLENVRICRRKDDVIR